MSDHDPAPVRLPERLSRILPQGVGDQIAERGIPQPVYAAVGAWSALNRADLPGAALRLAADAPAGVVRLPVTVAGGVAGGVRMLRDFAGGSASVVGQRAAAVRGAAATAYRDLSDEGRDAVIAYAAERSVRTRVSRVEDRIAPRAGRAAVRVMERRRRLQESDRLRRATQTARRTREAARRGAQRFAELNAPVLAEDAGAPPSPASS